MDPHSPTPFTADDLYLHKTLSTLGSGPGQAWLVFPVKRALREQDGTKPRCGACVRPASATHGN